jgi:hypothetical protein
MLVAVDLNGEGGEGAGDELSIENSSDDDEQLRIFKECLAVII